MSKQSDQKINTKKPWKPYGLAAYLAQAKHLATHTTKSVNTNADGDGARVNVENRADMPYACVRFGRDPVDLDYTNGATASPVTEQIDAVLHEDFHRFSDVDEAECADIRDRVLPTLHQASSPGASVSPRLRQILVDDGQGGDVSLTPLHSGGLSRRLQVILNGELAAISKETGKGTSAFFDDVVVKVGGDKGQNAGRIHLIGAMQHAYRFDVPMENEDPGIRDAISTWHRGVPLWIPRALLEDYAKFLSRLKIRDSSKGLSLQKTDRRMDEESVHIVSMTHHVLRQANLDIERLRPYVGTVLDGFSSPDLPLVQRGLMDNDLRDDAWKVAFADTLAQTIASAKTKDGALVVGISGRSASFLKPYILEVL